MLNPTAEMERSPICEDPENDDFIRALEASNARQPSPLPQVTTLGASFLTRPHEAEEDIATSFKFDVHNRKGMNLQGRYRALDLQITQPRFVPQPERIIPHPAWLTTTTRSPQQIRSLTPAEQSADPVTRSELPGPGQQVALKSVEEIKRAFCLKVPEMIIPVSSTASVQNRGMWSKVTKPTALRATFRKRLTSSHLSKSFRPNSNEIVGWSEDHGEYCDTAVRPGTPDPETASCNVSENSAVSQLPLTIMGGSSIDSLPMQRTSDHGKQQVILDDTVATVQPAPQQTPRIIQPARSPASIINDRQSSSSYESPGGGEDGVPRTSGIQGAAPASIGAPSRSSNELIPAVRFDPETPARFHAHEEAEHRGPTTRNKHKRAVFALVQSPASLRIGEQSAASILNSSRWRSDAGSKITKRHHVTARHSPQTKHSEYQAQPNSPSSLDEDFNAMLSRMRLKISAYEQSILSNADEVGRQRTRIRELEDEQERMRAVSELQRAQGEGQRQEHEAYRKKMSQLQEKSSKLESNLRNLGESFADLKALGEKTGLDCNQARTLVQDLKSASLDDREVIHKVTRRIDKIKANAQRIVTETSHDNEALQRTIEQLREELNRVTESLISEKDRASRLDTHLLTEQLLVTDVKEAMDSLNRTVDSRFAAATGQWNDNEYRTRVETMLQQCLEAVSGGVQGRELSPQAVEQLKFLLEAKVRTLQDPLEQLIKHTNEIPAEHKAFLNEIDTSIQTLREDLSARQATNNELQLVRAEASILATKNDSLARECAALNERLESSQAAISLHSEARQRLEDQIGDNLDRDTQISNVQVALALLQRSSIESENRLTKMAQELASTENDAEQARTALKANETYCKQIQDDLKLGRQTLQEQTVEFDRWKAGHDEKHCAERASLDALHSMKMAGLNSEHVEELQKETVIRRAMENELKLTNLRAHVAEKEAIEGSARNSQYDAQVKGLLAENEVLRSLIEESQIRGESAHEVHQAKVKELQKVISDASVERKRIDNDIRDLDIEVQSALHRLPGYNPVSANVGCSADVQLLRETSDAERARVVLPQLELITSHSRVQYASQVSAAPAAISVSALPRAPCSNINSVQGLVNSSPLISSNSLFRLLSPEITSDLHESSPDVDVCVKDEHPKEESVHVDLQFDRAEVDQGSRFFAEATAGVEKSRNASHQVEGRVDSPLSNQPLLDATQPKKSIASKKQAVKSPKSILKKPSELTPEAETDDRSSQTSASIELPFGGKHNKGLQTYGSVTRKNTFTLVTETPRRRTTTDRATEFFRSSTSSGVGGQIKTDQSTTGRQPSLASRAMQEFSQKQQPDFLEAVSTPVAKVQANETRPLSPNVQRSAKRQAAVAPGPSVTHAKKQRFVAGLN